MNIYGLIDFTIVNQGFSKLKNEKQRTMDKGIRVTQQSSSFEDEEF